MWKDYYAVLGVSKSASQEEIHEAFRVLARKYHPDHNPGDADAEERFKAVSEANDLLSDPRKRRVYDDQLWARGEDPQVHAAGRNHDDGPGRGFDFQTPDFAERRNTASGTISKSTVILMRGMIGVGLLTFFFSFITTDAPVRGRTEWSPFHMLISRADLWHPTPTGLLLLNEALYEIALIYMLMPITLLALSLPRPRKPLKYIAWVGLVPTMGLFKGGERGFSWVFYGDNSWEGFDWHGMHSDVGYYMFLAIMPILLWVASREKGG